MTEIVKVSRIPFFLLARTDRSIVSFGLHVFCYFLSLPLACKQLHTGWSELHTPQAAQALVVRSHYFFFLNLYANVQLAKTRYRDIVTTVTYCYVTTLRETWLWPFSMWRCSVKRFEFTKVCMGKNVKKHFSRNLDICRYVTVDDGGNYVTISRSAS